MLTISGYKKLVGVVLKDGLKVRMITDVGDAYSIWLSDNSNIELERQAVNMSNNYPLYRMFIGYRGTAMTEFVTIKTIRTLELMVKQLIYIKEKYT
jgi:hypothetical protein